MRLGDLRFAFFALVGPTNCARGCIPYLHCDLQEADCASAVERGSILLLLPPEHLAGPLTWTPSGRGGYLHRNAILILRALE